MKFCPTCEVKMRRGADGLICPKCGHTNAQGGEPATPASSSSAAADSSDGAQGIGALNVFDDSDEDESRPTIKIECEKCGNDEAVWWMLQTRSADEPTTQFYRCTKCQYTWRDYS